MEYMRRNESSRREREIAVRDEKRKNLSLRWPRARSEDTTQGR